MHTAQKRSCEYFSTLQLPFAYASYAVTFLAWPPGKLESWLLIVYPFDMWVDFSKKKDEEPVSSKTPLLGGSGYLWVFLSYWVVQSCMASCIVLRKQM